MKKYSNEFKVGIFFILSVIGLTALTLRTGKLNFQKKGYNIDVVFSQIAGLEVKSPVRLNGYEVGEVQEVRVVNEGDKTSMVLTLFIDQGIKIRSNPSISIKTLGLMGEKYVEISSYSGENFIEPDTTLKGQPYVDLDVLIANLNDLSGGISQLTGNLNHLVESNKEAVSDMINNLDAASKNLEEFTEDIKNHPWKLLFKK